LIKFWLLILENFQFRIYSILAIFSQRKKGRGMHPIRKRAGALKNQKVEDKKLKCRLQSALGGEKKELV
jgi:hypothetical protein